MDGKLPAMDDDFQQKVPASRILFSGSSALTHITVLEREGKRLLAFGKNAEEHETAFNPLDPDEPVFEYPCLMAPALALHPDTKKLLILGLGGAYLPGVIQRHRPDIDMTVVEIDSLVCQLAQEFFHFSADGSVQLVQEDARTFVAQTKQKYDQIWIDAYGGNYIPSPLMTLEFLELCGNRLNFKGVLVQNIHSTHPLYQAHLATFAQIFPFFYHLAGKRGTNTILIGQKDTPQPNCAQKAFLKGIKRHGPRLGKINIKAEIKKASIMSDVPCRHILRDEK